MAAIPPREQFRCPACGRPLQAAPGSSAPPVICPQCGSWTDRPLDRDSIAPQDRHLIVAGTTEDDGRAYGVFGEKPSPACPSCGKPLAETAEICSHCNWHREAGKVLPKTYPPYQQTWEAGWSYSQRFTAILICQAVNVVTAAILLWIKGGLPTTVGGWIVLSAMQAFVLGTYDRLSLARTTKGKVTLTKTWRVCFWPLPTKVIRWREYEGVIVRYSTAGVLEWVMFFMLLPGIVLPFVWWWYVIRPSRVMVALTQNLGDPAYVLYDGIDEVRAKEIANTVREVTGLRFEPLG